MTTLEQHIENIEAFFTDENRVYWSLNGSNANHISKTKNRLQTFFEDQDDTSFETSMERLKAAIYRNINCGYSWFVVFAWAHSKDVGERKYAFYIKPYQDYKENQNSQISGVQQFQQSNNQILQLMQQQFEERSRAQEDRFNIQMQHMKEMMQRDREIQNLKDSISGLKESKKSTLDSLIEKGQPIIEGVIMKLMEQSKKEEEKDEKQPETPPKKPAQKRVEISEHEQRFWGNIRQATLKINDRFGDADKAILEYALLCKNNPEIAQQIREEIRNKGGQNETN